jgi:hypothetical protein
MKLSSAAHQKARETNSKPKNSGRSAGQHGRPRPNVSSARAEAGALWVFWL